MSTTRYHAPQATWPWAQAADTRCGVSEMVAGLQLVSASLALPFDVMREQHARSVNAGLMANSILESRDFERTVDALEHVTLGPFARHC